MRKRSIRELGSQTVGPEAPGPSIPSPYQIITAMKSERQEQKKVSTGSCLLQASTPRVLGKWGAVVIRRWAVNMPLPRDLYSQTPQF